MKFLFQYQIKTDVFAVVTKQINIYKLAVFCDETVPPFGPTLPNPPEFQVIFFCSIHFIYSLHT